MSRMIFVNLPVTNLAKAIGFYEAIGAKNNPHFTDETAACMVFSETIHVMLLTHAKWATFTSKLIVNAHAANEVMLALTCESRDAVNAMVVAAGKAGGAIDVNPLQDFGFMLNRNFADLDGHAWEAIWMDPSGLPPA